MNPELRAHLVCPVDHGALYDADDALMCTICAMRYPVIDDIPSMIPAESSDSAQQETA